MSEIYCPFCGAVHAPSARAPARMARMSRARWLALGSALALVSCGGGDNPGSTGNTLHNGGGGSGGGGTGGNGNGGGGGISATAGGGGESGGGGGESGAGGGGGGGGGGSVAEVDASAGDAGADVANGDAADGSNACSPTGTFTCNGQTCNAATQYCQMSFGNEVACNDDDGGIWFPQECGSCPTCACITPYLTPNCQCVDFDAGAGIGVECATCYGAPPTRLELLASA